jgi:hypothetical protein
MLVVGEQTMFLSHLPMFEAMDGAETTYTAPVRYQVILEASFTKEGNDVQGAYARDRQEHPATKMYTLSPECFVLPDLFTPTPQNPSRASFKATVFRGHLERDGQEIETLSDVTVRVKRVVHARQFKPRQFKPMDGKPEKLEYLLFGKGQEFLLAHWIAKPPDFDQIIAVKIDNETFTDEELSQGISVVIRERENSSSQRIKEGEQVTGQGHVTGAHQFSELHMQATREVYFEEGELRIPPDFGQTEEERKGGF